MKMTQRIATRTRRLLKERHWTQYKLARQAAVPISTLHHVISGRSQNVKIETLLNICRGFEISLADFFNDALFSPENIPDND